MRLSLAVRLFLRALLDADAAERLRATLDDSESSPTVAEPSIAAKEIPHDEPARSDAISLLATLQREARLVDIVKEPLSDYSDEQIGAAARDVLRDCGQVLDRLFGIQPVVDGEEGIEMDTPPDYDPGRFRLSGNVSGEPPFSGQLVHHGWCATHCELPKWTGSSASALVISPAELEVK